MAQRMRRDWPRDARSRTGPSAGIFNGVRRDRLPGLPAREQPLFRPGRLPVITHKVQQTRRKHHVTIFPPFARLYTNDHPLAVNGGWLQPDRLGHAQPRRVADGQNHPLLRAFHRVQESGNLLGTQHFGKLARLPAGGDVILDGPFPAKRDGVEEPKRGHRDGDRTGCQKLVLGQINLPGADLSRPQTFRRLAEMTSEPIDLFNVGDLRPRGEVTNPHVLDHATAKRGHGQLLCEMSSATWRRRILSKLSCQNRSSGPSPPPRNPRLGNCSPNHTTPAERVSPNPYMGSVHYGKISWIVPQPAQTPLSVRVRLAPVAAGHASGKVAPGAVFLGGRSRGRGRVSIGQSPRVHEYV